LLITAYSSALMSSQPAGIGHEAQTTLNVVVIATLALALLVSPVQAQTAPSGPSAGSACSVTRSISVDPEAITYIHSDNGATAKFLTYTAATGAPFTYVEWHDANGTLVQTQFLRGAPGDRAGTLPLALSDNPSIPNT
jgi:hypothetical protein